MNDRRSFLVGIAASLATLLPFGKLGKAHSNDDFELRKLKQQFLPQFIYEKFIGGPLDGKDIGVWVNPPPGTTFLSSIAAKFRSSESNRVYYKLDVNLEDKYKLRICQSEYVYCDDGSLCYCKIVLTYVFEPQNDEERIMWGDPNATKPEGIIRCEM